VKNKNSVALRSVNPLIDGARICTRTSGLSLPSILSFLATHFYYTCWSRVCVHCYVWNPLCHTPIGLIINGHGHWIRESPDDPSLITRRMTPLRSRPPIAPMMLPVKSSVNQTAFTAGRSGTCWEVGMSSLIMSTSSVGEKDCGAQSPD